MDALRAEAQGIQGRLEALEVIIPMHVGENEKLYGSVTSAIIGDALVALGVEVDRRRILLDTPIRSLGEHPVRIRLHADVIAVVPVKVISDHQPEEEEATPEVPATRGRRERSPGRGRPGRVSVASHHESTSAPGREAGAALSSRAGQGERTSGNRAESDLLRRVPPHSAEAEQAVLGGVLLRPQLMHSIVDTLTAEDFYLPSHTIIFRAFLELYRKSAPIDLISTAEQLKSRNELEDAGGAVYLGDLSQAVVSGANAEYYATIVRDKSLQRGLIEACSGIIATAMTPRGRWPRCWTNPSRQFSPFPSALQAATSRPPKNCWTRFLKIWPNWPTPRT